MTASDADMVLGVVRVPNWRNHSADVVRRYLRAYHSKGKSHNHIHGANMGFRGDAYWAVDGFRALPTGEDVELVDRFEAANLSDPPRRHAVGGDLGSPRRSCPGRIRTPSSRAVVHSALKRKAGGRT